MIISGLMPTAAALILFFILKKINLPYTKKKYWIFQVIAGLLFGGVCIISTETAPSFQGAVLNIRTASVSVCSFVFGWPAGFIAGCIGSLERGLSILWNSGRAYTEAACTIATFVAGIAAGAMKKYIFNDKIPTPLSATATALVIEIFHMLLVFLTNMNDVSRAFVFVENVTLKMVLVNTGSVFVTMVIIYAILYKQKDSEWLDLDGRKIASTIQRSLFIAVALTFVLSIGFAYFIENNMTHSNATSTMINNITDVKNELGEKSSAELEYKVSNLAYKIEKDNYPALNYLDLDKFNNFDEVKIKDYQLYQLNMYIKNLADANGYSEVHLINTNGYIYATSNTQGSSSDFKYNMNSKEQSKEFNVLLDSSYENPFYVQTLQSKGNSKATQMKYCGFRLYKYTTDAQGNPVRVINGYVQLGYDISEYQLFMFNYIYDSTTYRQVGSEGRLMIADRNETIISDRNQLLVGEKLSSPTIFGVEISKMPAKTLLQRNMFTGIPNVDPVPTFFVFEETEGYYIVGTMSVAEVDFSRDMMVYVIAFSEIIIFAIIFVFIYLVINKVVVKRIHRINNSLSEITSGNLDVVVDVKENREFASLSNDINKTVVTLKKYIDEANQRIDRELIFARNIQLSSLPTPLETQKGLDLYSLMATAKEVGGDFYDFYYVDKDHLAILVADVSGKGIPAALFMMKSKTLIKSLAKKGMHADEIFTAANKELCSENEAEMFVTAWMGIIDTQTGEMEYVNAGHNAPLIGTQKKHDFHYFKTAANLVLGGFDSFKFKSGKTKLEKGQTIFLYTDGVTEATNSNNELYGEDRLLKEINKVDGVTNKILVQTIKQDVDEFVGEAPQFDDITMLAFTFLGKGEMFKLDITSDKKDFERAFEFITYRLSEAMTPAKLNHLLIAMDEILSNISNYAYGDKQGPITIIIKNIDEDVNITIVDEGTPYNPLEKEDPDISLSAEERQIGGLGIFMVKKLMDDVKYYYDNHCNILIMSCKRK